MNSPGVIYWSELFRQTLQKRVKEGRNTLHASLELIEAIAETNERILEEEKDK